MTTGRQAQMELAQRLDPHNFYISTDGWKILKRGWFKPFLVFGKPVLVHPSEDVWQIQMPDGSFEQFFTLDAAQRETSAVGKKLPSGKDWKALAISADALAVANKEHEKLQSASQRHVPAAPSTDHTFGWSAERVVSILWLRLCGMRNWENAKFERVWLVGCFWSSTNDGVFWQAAYFEKGWGGITKPMYRTMGLSVRCMSERAETLF